MSQSDPAAGRQLEKLTSDLRAVVRRHDPAWTGSNDSDPGVTLLELAAWLGERFDAVRGTSVWQTVAATAARRDPYRDFNFRVELNGTPVAGVTHVSALRQSAEIVEYRDGASPDVVQRIPGRRTCEPFTLERPLGADTAFEDWAVGTALRRNVRIEILDKTGRLYLAYDVTGCWPTAYQILPTLTERLTLVPETWQRDRSVTPVA
jgi:phage tail-like protein